jgi:hypothetical protein
LHVPPDPLASFHYPGSTLFIVITQLDVAVRWLAEQDGRLTQLWGAYQTEVERDRCGLMIAEPEKGKLK